MKGLSYTLSGYASLIMCCTLIASQHSDQKETAPIQRLAHSILAEPDWEKQYDYVYDQLDRKEIRAEKRLQYISSLSQAETSWSIPASKKQEKQLRLREKKRLVSKLQRTVNMLATDTLVKNGLDPQSVTIRIKLCQMQKK